MEKYQTIEILGQGSFGTVYLIADNKGKKYALKKVQVNPFKIDEALKQIEVMGKLKHPNLIYVYQSYYDNNQKLQIMMQFCEGGDLLAYFKKNNKNLSINQILAIFHQIVQAFVAISVKGVIHRDLKPQNVLLAKNKVIKIADFGCAREVEYSIIQNLSLDKGTPIYSSPQQLMNEPYSGKCDVWAAGCLLYFLYFGSHPFLDNSVQNTLLKIKKLTQNKQIKLQQNTDLTVQKILKLTLVYSDRNRATWRQLHLSRLFNKKVADIESFLIYLRSISNIANWITKEFWKNRKCMTIGNNKNEMFAYFTIKFQYTNSIMGVDIIKKSPQFLHLFEPNAYKNFNPGAVNIVKQIQNDVSPCQKYYKSIKNHMAEKQVYSIIKEKQPQRISSFSDLDNSIRAAYKILQDVLPQLKSNKKDPSQKAMELIWVMMSRWINFEAWFSYEKKPRVEDFINQSISNPALIVQSQLEKYTRGILE